MPTKDYFGGHGEKVKKDMIRKHGIKKGTEIFYATANKQNQTPKEAGDAGFRPAVTPSDDFIGNLIRALTTKRPKPAVNYGAHPGVAKLKAKQALQKKGSAKSFLAGYVRSRS